MDYYEHFKDGGSDLPLYRGSRNQRGHGLGNWFKSFYRFVVPFLKKHAVPLIKKGATIVGTEAIRTAANVATDKIAGKKLEESGRDRIYEGIDNISKKWNQKGSGRRKKKKRKSEISITKNSNKIRRLKDIFDSHV